MAKILDGHPILEKKKIELKNFFSKIKNAQEMAVVFVGNKPESVIYIKKKIDFGEEIGVKVREFKFSESISEESLIQEIKKINQNKKIGGIIVQLPLLKHLDERKVIDLISINKDVDGLTSENLGRLLKSDSRAILPATTRGIITLLDYYEIKISGKNILILGRSTLVGRPTVLALLSADATVTVAHSKTQNIDELIKNSEIIVSAVGKPGLINKNNTNSGQVIIDVGITFVDFKNKKILKGDVDFEEVSQIVLAISPVPGGVGPLTVLSLFENFKDIVLNK